MYYIVILLLISLEKVSDPDIQYYYINDFANPIIASGNIENACWNPTAINGVESLSFAGSAVYTNGNFITILGEDYKYKTSEFLPELLGVAFPLKEKFSLGLLFSVPYKDSYNSPWLPVMPEDSVSSSLKLRFYAFNPIISYKIKENLSVGLNFAILAKKYDVYSYYNTPDDPIYAERHGLYFGIEPNLGIQYKLNEVFRIDAAIKKGFVQGKENWTNKEYSIDEEYSIKEILPLIASLGTQINITPQLTINNAAEFFHWKGESFYVDGEKEEASHHGENVFRINMGGEYKIKSKYALRLGISDFFSSFSNIIGRDQIFLMGGIGVDFGKLKVNFAVSNNSLISNGYEETNNFHLSIAYQ